jgi:hypothetical protein
LAKAGLTEIIEHLYFNQQLCLIQADVFQMPCLRQAPNRYEPCYEKIEINQDLRMNDIKDFDIQKLFEVFEYWGKYAHKTEFYCEGWLMRLLILSVSDFGLENHELYINNNCNYFSEPLLYSPFLAKRGENKLLAERFTHADSAIGEFIVGNKNKGSLDLTGNNLKIFEAKIYSQFSPKVKNSPFYDQVARYIACITETIQRANKINVLSDLQIGFYLVLPENQFAKKSTYNEYLNKEHIREVVQKRIEQYKSETSYAERKSWFNNEFEMVLKKIDIKPLFYEDIISELSGYKFHREIFNYYSLCLKYNKKHGS